MRNKNKFKMITTIIGAITVPGIILLLIFVGMIVFGAIYVTTGNRGLLITLIIYFFILALAFIASTILIIRSLYMTFYDGLYLTTHRNLRALSSNHIYFSKYPNTNIEELDYLNEMIDVTAERFNNAVLVSPNPDYNNLNLDYISRNKNLITFKSFEKNIGNIIFLSQSFRNLIIDANFGNIEGIDESYKMTLLDIFDEKFSSYRKRLFAFRVDQTSLLIYLPAIDSFSRINEILEELIRECSISIKRMSGAENVAINFAAVCYPYSDVDDILSDLRYAKRQGKAINFYLPDRIKVNNDINKNILTNSMNLNYMSKILSKYAQVKFNLDEEENNKIILKNLFEELGAYLDIDESGIILYEDIKKIFEHYLHIHHKEEIKNIVGADFIETLEEVFDADSTYYFSSRSHLNKSLGNYMDLNNISSGFFYIMKENDKIVGLIYLFKRDNKDFIVDSYIRECLEELCINIQHYFHEFNYIRDVEMARSEAENILSLSNYGLYKVDEDMRITYYSEGLKRIFPDIKKNEKCHKSIFNRDIVCHDCPLRSQNKRSFDLNNNQYLISTTLNDRRSITKSLLVERLTLDDSSRVHDLYDNNLLINSFYALRKNIENSYHISGRGYLLLLTIDNMSDIIEKQGSEGSLYVIRSFIKKLKNTLKTEEVYFYNHNTIGLLLHNAGHVGVINLCEKIFEIADKHEIKEGEEEKLHLTYLPLSWPRGYANANDFLKHVSDFYNSTSYTRNKDYIYFADHSIARSASKRVFMIEVIEQEFSSSTFSNVSLQPIVSAKDKRIYGAEILLRINNVYSNAVFNAEEISNIAEQEGKTSLITESIINFIGTMYKEYGNSVFKINAFKRIAINIDSTYFKDPSLIKGILSLNSTYQFPRGFLSFEVPEDIVPNYQLEIQNMIKELASANIMLSVDRYTGKYMSIDKLRELGFREVKLTRDLIGKIDVDSVRYNEVADIAKHAKEMGVALAAVGVENSAQFTMLKELDPNMLMQGFHFYKPLSRSDFISALISHNN